MTKSNLLSEVISLVGSVTRTHLAAVKSSFSSSEARVNFLPLRTTIVVVYVYDRTVKKKPKHEEQHQTEY